MIQVRSLGYVACRNYRDSHTQFILTYTSDYSLYNPDLLCRPGGRHVITWHLKLRKSDFFSVQCVHISCVTKFPTEHFCLLNTHHLKRLTSWILWSPNMEVSLKKETGKLSKMIEKQQKTSMFWNLSQPVSSSNRYRIITLILISSWSQSFIDHHGGPTHPVRHPAEDILKSPRNSPRSRPRTRIRIIDIRNDRQINSLI